MFFFYLVTVKNCLFYNIIKIFHDTIILRGVNIYSYDVNQRLSTSGSLRSTWQNNGRAKQGDVSTRPFAFILNYCP